MSNIQLRLIQLGALIDYCKQAKNTIEPLVETLYPIFHAIEWFDSGDIGEDDVKEAFTMYRNAKQGD